MHVNVQVTTVHGIEAHLLNAGTGCDLTGVGLTELARDDLEQIVADHPRVGLAEGFSALIAEQARRRPKSRASLLHRFGLRAIIQRAPFPPERGFATNSCDGPPKSERLR